MTIAAIRKYQCKKCHPNLEQTDYIQHAIDQKERESNLLNDDELNDLFKPAHIKRAHHVD